MTTEINTLDPQTEKILIRAQRNEITEHLIYKKLSYSVKEKDNKEVLQRIAEDELKHHNICLHFTCQDVKPHKIKVWMHYFISVLFGITFSLKLMERGEEQAHLVYTELSKAIPGTTSIARDELKHERQLIDLIDDERLKYTSDIVRGLNVAIVEITGALAGLTLAFESSKLIIPTGMILGIIMSLSVASTEYIATKSGSSVKNPLKSVLYAGLANLLTVFFLLLPYLIFENIYLSLGVMIINAIFVIYIFSFYMSVIRDLSVRKIFLEMASISLGIAILAFGIGFLARELLHIEVV